MVGWPPPDGAGTGTASLWLLHFPSSVASARGLSLGPLAEGSEDLGKNYVCVLEHFLERG